MKIDPAFTQKIQDWLSVPEQDRDVQAGATLLLQLNRNRALYNAITLKPAKMAAKLEYELRKFLRMRLDNMTVADVARMQSEIMPAVKKTVDYPPTITTDKELPEGVRAIGRRADHDQLPARIQALWDANLSLYRGIRLYYNECLALTDQGAAPCDLYERLKMLAEADKKYRDNLAAYDSYVPGSEPEEKELTKAEIERRIVAERKMVSKYRKAATDLAHDKHALSKIQQHVTAVLGYGGDFSPATRKELGALGIKFD